jgi:hypothetical protein
VPLRPSDNESTEVPLVLVPYTGGRCSAFEMRSRGLFGVVSRQRPGMDLAGTNDLQQTEPVQKHWSAIRIVAAINGPTHLLLCLTAKKFNEPTGSDGH